MIAPKRRRGFTLTEILMAAGIMGIGLTMIASIFPVAVDQNRRSHDTTMAALSARSTSALMRARRDYVMQWVRRDTSATSSNPSTAARFTMDMNPEFSTTGSVADVPRVMAPAMQCYNPDSFLYDPRPPELPAPQGYMKIWRQYNPYLNSNTPHAQWSMGSYVPVVFSTPIGKNGPQRLTIVIYKSRGQVPDYLLYPYKGSRQGPYTPPSWVADPTSTNPVPYRVMPGEYVMDSRRSDYASAPSPAGKENYRGEAYMVERVEIATNTTGQSDKIYLASAPISTILGQPYLMTASGSNDVSINAGAVNRWSSLPGALIVFHTIIGD